MNKAWVFIEICKAWEKKNQVDEADLKRMSLESSSYSTSSSYEPITTWRVHSTIERLIKSYVSWGLVKKEDYTLDCKTGRQVKPLVLTDLGISIWEKIVKPLMEGQKIDWNHKLLFYSDKTSITESKPRPGLLCPDIYVQLDPVPEPVFPLLRETLEEIGVDRPWISAIANRKFCDEIRVRIIRRRLNFRDALGINVL